MAELSLFWDGITGDAGPYTDDDLMDTVFRALLNGDGNRGVLYGVWGELEVFGVYPSASASASSSRSASPSPSASASASPSLSTSPSASASASESISPSPSSSESSSPSSSPSASPSPSGSPSASESASPSPSPVAGLDVYVRSGAAIVYGLYYESDEVETITLPDDSKSYVVVRRDWTIPNARLTYTDAITQNPPALGGTTYDIPLAEVDTAGGDITSITDLREFCEYSGDVQLRSVVTEYIEMGVVTPAKMIDQTRRLFRGGGALKPDFGSPALRVNYDSGRPYSNRWREDLWQFNDVEINGVWASIRVPEDFTGTTMEVFIHITWVEGTYAVPRYQKWGFNCYSSQPGVAFGIQSKTTTTRMDYAWYWKYKQRLSLGTITVSAGDIVLIRIYRDGTSITDTSDNLGLLHAVEFEYTADS